MANSKPVLSGINLVSKDMKAAVTFYRKLGLDIPESAIWSSESGAHHIKAPGAGDVVFELDSTALAGIYNAGYDAKEERRSVLGFTVETREAVDELYAELTEAGYRGVQPPWDAFWGARYSIIEDPDGNHVGIMSPADDEHRGPPPQI